MHTIWKIRLMRWRMIISETDDDLETMSKQELIELVQSLRRELTDAQETIEYLNDTIDDIHEQEMDELCEE